MLLWTDIETTGLDPQDDLILEVGWLITDDQLNVIRPLRSAVIENSIKRVRSMCDEYVTKMHYNSGLFHAIEFYPTYPLGEVEQWIIEDIEAVSGSFLDSGTEKPRFAGSSVHYDKSFLTLRMPELAKRAHYRIYDVTTIQQLFTSVGIVEGGSFEGTRHRAADDIANSWMTAVDMRNMLQAATFLPGFDRAFEEMGGTFNA